MRHPKIKTIKNSNRDITKTTSNMSDLSWNPQAYQTLKGYVTNYSWWTSAFSTAFFRRLHHHVDVRQFRGSMLRWLMWGSMVTFDVGWRRWRRIRCRGASQMTCPFSKRAWVVHQGGPSWTRVTDNRVQKVPKEHQGTKCMASKSQTCQIIDASSQVLMPNGTNGTLLVWNWTFRELLKENMFMQQVQVRLSQYRWQCCLTSLDPRIILVGVSMSSIHCRLQC